MPKVGSKHFSYSAKGEAAAKAEAKKSSQPVERAPGKGGQKSAQPPFMKKKPKR